MATLQNLFSTGIGVVIAIVLLVALAAAIVWGISRTRGIGKGPSYPSLEQKPGQTPPQTEAPMAGEMGSAASTLAPPLGQGVEVEQTEAAEAELAGELEPQPEHAPQTGEAPEQPETSEAPERPEAVNTPEAPELPGTPAKTAERPESVPSRMQRLRSRLAHAGGIGKALLGVLSRGNLKAADWEEIEDTLLMADLGLPATEELMAALKTRMQVEGASADQARAVLHDELLKLVDPSMDRSLNVDRPEVDGNAQPASILMVGVNGTGKTTTVGKLARVLVAEGKTVLLGAADTFRAAAADQLQTWGERVGVDVVRSDKEGADPASVAFDAIKQGKERGVDVVVVDTAGRLQTKSTLMDELGKIERVMSRTAPVSEVLLVLDATTGQNGMRQAQVFAEVAHVTGIVLTKLDGSAKGGIVVSVQRELGVPVKLVGLGEGPDDLAPFDPEGFVRAIVGE